VTYLTLHLLHIQFLLRVFRFSRRRAWRWLSSGLVLHAFWWVFTDVSKVLAGSILRAMTVAVQGPRHGSILPAFPSLHPLIHLPDDGGSKHLLSVDKPLPNYTVQHPEDSHLHNSVKRRYASMPLSDSNSHSHCSCRSRLYVHKTALPVW
jgi:hypothetical protein